MSARPECDDDARHSKHLCSKCCVSSKTCATLAGSPIDGFALSTAQVIELSDEEILVLDMGLKKVTESMSSLILRAPKGKFFNNIQPISVGV